MNTKYIGSNIMILIFLSGAREAAGQGLQQRGRRRHFPPSSRLARRGLAW
jgi:hypothetical protein